MSMRACAPAFAVFAALLLGGVLLGAVGEPGAEVVANGRAAPEIAAGPWVNSAPLTIAGLRGRVVLLDFWTFG